MKTSIDELKEKMPLPALMSAIGHGYLVKKGLSKCPFHDEKTSSFGVYKKNGDNLFKCFGCGAQGNEVTYLQHAFGLEVKNAIIKYNEIVNGIDCSAPIKPMQIIEDVKPVIDAQKIWLDWYLDTDYEKAKAYVPRELGLEYQYLNQIGLSEIKGTDDWAFPMHDGNENCIGIRVRHADGTKASVKGSRSGIFLPLKQFPKEIVFIVEGATDCAAALQIGLFAIGRPSCNGCEESTLSYLGRYKNIKRVIVVSDNDEPGINGANKLISRLKHPALLWIPPAKDLRQFVINGGTKEIIKSLLKDLVWKKK